MFFDADIKGDGLPPKTLCSAETTPHSMCPNGTS